jgi:hypothetical protein
MPAQSCRCAVRRPRRTEAASCCATSVEWSSGGARRSKRAARLLDCSVTARLLTRNASGRSGSSTSFAIRGTRFSLPSGSARWRKICPIDTASAPLMRCNSQRPWSGVASGRTVGPSCVSTNDCRVRHGMSGSLSGRDHRACAIAVELDPDYSLAWAGIARARRRPALSLSLS